MLNGKFIVLDGNDGSGKQTQAKLLAEALTQQEQIVHPFDFPRYDTNQMGKLLRECLDGKRGDFVHMDARIVSVLYAVDRFESSGQIREWLDAGEIVICDRYTTANMIHQGGKIADIAKRAEFIDWLERLEFCVLQLPRPDITLYLDVPVEISLENLKQRNRLNSSNPDTVEQSLQYLEQSRQSAQLLAQQMDNWHTVQCCDKSGQQRTREAIHAEIFRLVQNFVK